MRAKEKATSVQDRTRPTIFISAINNELAAKRSKGNLRQHIGEILPTDRVRPVDRRPGKDLAALFERSEQHPANRDDDHDHSQQGKQAKAMPSASAELV